MEKELKQVQAIFPEADIIPNIIYVDNKFTVELIGDKWALHRYCHLICVSKNFNKILAVLQAIKECDDE